MRPACIRAKRAGAAGFGIELDGLAGFEGLHLAGGAVMVLARRSIRKSALVNRPGWVRARPWLGEHRSPAARRRDDGAVDVGAIDMELDERKPWRLMSSAMGTAPSSSGRFAGSRRRRQSPGSPGHARCAPCSRRIASSGSCARGASAVFDRDAPVGSDAFSDAHAAVGVLQVLGADLREGLDVRAQRLDDVVQVAVHPALQRGDLALDDPTAMAFCLGSLQSMSSPALMLDASSSGMPALRQISSGSRSSELRHELHDAAGGMAEKVDRVLNPPGSR